MEEAIPYKGAKLMYQIENIDDDILALAGDSASALGTGGMRTKLSAAQLCTSGGCDMIIANGADPDILYAIADGEKVGTRFIAGGKA